MPEGSCQCRGVLENLTILPELRPATLGVGPPDAPAGASDSGTTSGFFFLKRTAEISAESERAFRVPMLVRAKMLK